MTSLWSTASGRRRGPSRRHRLVGPLFALIGLGIPALVLWPLAAGAQGVDTRFWVTDGQVNAVVQSGDTIYLGGSFSYVGPNTGGGVPLDITSGTPEAPYAQVAGQVYAVAPDGAGGWYIGGSFDAVGSVPRSGLAHVLADGTVADWDPKPDRMVIALAVSGSTVYAGGYFTNIGGQDRNQVAALDATTGAATAWNPDVGASESFPAVEALVVSETTVYVGGLFSHIGGQNRNSIAALDVTTGAATAWNPNSDGVIMSLAVSGATVYAGGYFSTIGGHPRSCIAALDRASGLVTAWNSTADSCVRALAVSGTTVYAGGDFSRIGGQARRRIAALDTATGAATAWDPNASGEYGRALRIYALAVSGTTVYAGGDFASIGGAWRQNLAGIDMTTGSSIAWDPSAGGNVHALAVSGAAVYAGGEFTSVGGQARKCLAAFDAATGSATAWNPNGRVNPETWASVSALVASGQTVYVGGDFTSIAGLPRNHLAALDATTGAVTSWNPDADGMVRTLALDGSRIYAGGTFNKIGGQSRSAIAALDATTGAATDWNPSAGGGGDYGPFVYALAVNGSTVFAGGSFDQIGGRPRSNIAALDAATGAATPWDPHASVGYTSGIHALTVSGTTVYAGGNFRNIGGQPRNNLAALDLATGAANSWDPNADGWVYAIAADGATVYAGGDFRNIGRRPNDSLAALDAATGEATLWSPGAKSTVNSVVVSGATVYVGGWFYSIGGEKPHRSFAAINRSAAATVYPGDANNDGLVDAFDILPIGLYYGLSGPQRPGHSLGWGPQLLWTPWSHPNESAVYADCDGDGVVGALDVLAIVQNWHARPGQPASPDVDRRSVCVEILQAMDRNSSAPGMASLRAAVVDYAQEAGGRRLQARLEQNRPNPFSGITRWMLTVPAPTSARLAVFDLRGGLVWRASLPNLKAGSTTITWDGTNLRGHRVAAGVYGYKLIAGDYQAAGKAILIR